MVCVASFLAMLPLVASALRSQFYPRPGIATVAAVCPPLLHEAGRHLRPLDLAQQSLRYTCKGLRNFPLPRREIGERVHDFIKDQLLDPHSDLREVFETAPTYDRNPERKLHRDFVAGLTRRMIAALKALPGEKMDERAVLHRVLTDLALNHPEFRTDTLLVMNDRWLENSGDMRLYLWREEEDEDDAFALDFLKQLAMTWISVVRESAQSGRAAVREAARARLRERSDYKRFRGMPMDGPMDGPEGVEGIFQSCIQKIEVAN